MQHSLFLQLLEIYIVIVVNVLPYSEITRNTCSEKLKKIKSLYFISPSLNKLPAAMSAFIHDEKAGQITT